MIRVLMIDRPKIRSTIFSMMKASEVAMLSKTLCMPVRITRSKDSSQFSISIPFVPLMGDPQTSMLSDHGWRHDREDTQDHGPK